jgi:hypothetical protein
MTFINTGLSLRADKTFCRGKKTSFFIFFRIPPRRMPFPPLKITFFRCFRLNSPRVKCQKRRSNVRMTKTFSEALEEQLAQNPSENSGEISDSHYSSHVEYAHFSKIKFKRSPSFTTTPSANSHSSYRAQARTSANQKAVEAPADYILEIHQKSSFDYFNQRLNPAHRLLGSFSAQQLKTAFRRLAKASHPDTGGSAELFRELVDQFKVLSNFLATRTPQT